MKHLLFAGLFLAALVALPMRGVANPPADALLTTSTTDDGAAAVPSDDPAPVFRTDNMRAFEQWVLQHVDLREAYYAENERILLPVSFKLTRKGKVNEANAYPSAYVNDDFTKQVLQVMKTSTWDATDLPKNFSGKLLLDVMVRRNADGAFYADDIKIHEKVDTEPTFQGGGAKRFRAWVKERVRLPEDVDTLSGRVSVRIGFVLEKDGTTSDLQVGTEHAALQDAVAQIVAEADGWRPALIGQKPVRCAVGIRLVFGRSDEEELSGDGDIVLMAETMPSFQGGDLNKFREWLGDNVSYPSDLISDGVTGRVTAAFVIERDGSLSSVKILDSPHARLSEIVKNTLLRSPKWSPGMQYGSAVRVAYTLPIDFKLSQAPLQSDFPQSSTHPRSAAGHSGWR